MRSFLPIAAASLASFPAASPAIVPDLHHHARAANEIQWEKCDIGLTTTVPGDCGTLKAPLDYTNKECNRTIDLQIFRVPAVKEPKKGSIFLNFGGPGASGEAEVGAFSDRILACVSPPSSQE